METFAFLLKTYEQDFSYAVRLLKSFSRYNADSLMCFVVLPESSERLLAGRLTAQELKGITFLHEEDFPGLVRESVGGISAGYINQEIVKLSFWELGLAENYFCLDSDGLFIREFHRKDFMYDGRTPYTVLFEDGDLRADPIYYKTFWVEREKSLKKIQEALDFHPYKMLTCHGFQNFSSTVLRSLKEEFMKPKGYRWSDLLAISPYEFSWYNFWLQKYQRIELHLCGEIFRTFHMKHHLEESWTTGARTSDLARSYVGIVINSNYTNGKMLDYDSRWERFKGAVRMLAFMICNIL